MTMDSAKGIDLKALIRTVPDFPRPGVMFRDITTLLKHPDALRAVVDGFVAAYHGRPIDKIAAIESRGFIVGAALAYRLRAGFVPIRKGGKLPAENFGQDYELEYGVDRLEVHRDGIQRGERVLLVDDLIATGGTAEAALKLIGIAGGSVVGCAFIVDLPDLGGRARLERSGFPVLALCQFAGH
jgi:adenine phosphoribosyltransferase